MLITKIMNFEKPKAQKIEINDDEKEIIVDELNHINKVLESLESGDSDYAYADTADSMEYIDSILSNDSIYRTTLEARKEASQKCISSDMTEKGEGLKQIKSWAENIKNLL